MPFRRGSGPDDEPIEASPNAERFEPEPEDERMRRRRAAGAAGAAGAGDDRRVDNTAANFDAEAEAARHRAEEEAAAAAQQDEANRRWARPADDVDGPFRRGQPGEGGLVPPIAAEREAAHAPEPPWPQEARHEAPPAAPAAEVIDRFDDEAYDEPDPRYYYETQERSEGIGIGAVLGIAALGVLALFVGIMLSGVFSGDDGVGQATPSPSVAVTPSSDLTAAPSQSAAASPSSSAASSSSPSDGPQTFPDGFVAEAQPCANPPNSPDCGSSGARNNGNVWIVVSFQNGTASDVVGATVEHADGTPVAGGGSLPLADIGCESSCRGYTYFAFQNLENGTYTVNVTRNGEPASETGFTVER